MAGLDNMEEARVQDRIYLIYFGRTGKIKTFREIGTLCTELVNDLRGKTL